MSNAQHTRGFELVLALCLTGLALAGCGRLPDESSFSDEIPPPASLEDQVSRRVHPGGAIVIGTTVWDREITAQIPFINMSDRMAYELDLGNGTVSALWNPVVSDEQVGAWTTSPDGTRVAYVRGMGPHEITVRPRVASDLPPPATVRLPPETTRPDLLWEPGGEAILVAYTYYAPPSDEYIAAPAGWDLRRVEVDKTGAVQGDSVLLHLEAEDLEHTWAELAAYDPVSRRVAALEGAGSNGVVTAILVLDVDTGEPIARFDTMDEGYLSLGSPDGRWVAITDYPFGFDAARHVRLVDVRGARVIDLARSGRPDGFAWSDDSQWLSWWTYDDGSRRVHAARVTGDAAEVVVVRGGIGARGIAFVPGLPVLLAGDRLLDLERGASRPFTDIQAHGAYWECDACATATP